MPIYYIIYVTYGIIGVIPQKKIQKKLFAFASAIRFKSVNSFLAAGEVAMEINLDL
jgi:hypothetical protein